MTTPDHTPYLTATDLRTPEDVLAWLRRPSLDRMREHRQTGGGRLQPYIDDEIMLTYRLDRERRQACRRGALENWRAFVDAHEARTGRRRKFLLKTLPLIAYRESYAPELNIPRDAYRDWALAFRAAARAK